MWWRVVFVFSSLLTIVIGAVEVQAVVEVVGNIIVGRTVVISACGRGNSNLTHTLNASTY